MRKLFIVGAATAFASVAFGQNLIQNPGFETGDFTGWTVDSIDGTFSGVTTAVPHTGAFSFQSGAVSSFGDQIHQTVSDVNGATYTLSFWALDEESGSGSSGMMLKFNGTTLYNSDPTGTYSQFSFNVVGTGNDTITISSWNSPSFSFIDDVSMVRASPEPASMAALGIGALALIRRRRFRK